MWCIAVQGEWGIFVYGCGVVSCSTGWVGVFVFGCGGGRIVGLQEGNEEVRRFECQSPGVGRVIASNCPGISGTVPDLLTLSRVPDGFTTAYCYVPDVGQTAIITGKNEYNFRLSALIEQ